METNHNKVAFYEKHKTAINIIIDVAVIGLCAVATVATAGTCGLAFAVASGALKGALIGALTGAAGGALNSAMDYMEEHDTLDGSGSKILEGAAKGFRDESISGAISGAASGAAKYAKNPSGYCFIAGTLVLTTVGLVSIENIQPSDVVYAKEAIGIEQSVDVTQDAETAPVLEVYSHEVDETYIVTIDGEDIETTAEHPFYDEDGEQVEAKDLKEGDELTTADGDTATVDSVECVHHDEPVTVYNFAVMEDHTYFVGESGVLVHNECDGSALSKGEKKLHEQATRRQAFRDAKEAAGIPKSSQYKTHKFVFDGSTENRMVYEFEVGNEKKYIIEHTFDKMGRGPHFHGADASKGSPFLKGRYKQFTGHFPEDMNGFK